MDLKLTEKELALKQEFADFFEKEMKNAPRKKGVGVYGTEEDSKENNEFTWYMMKKIAEKGWHIMAWPKEYDIALFFRRAKAWEYVCGDTDFHYERIMDRCVVEMPGY